MARRFVALSVQLATKAAKSPRFSSISGWSNAASAMAGSFFEQTASTMPRSLRRLA